MLDGAPSECERRYRQDQENEKTDFCQRRSAASNTAESEYPSNDGNDEQNNRPVKHDASLSFSGCDTPSDHVG